jgi:hypothetical protein
MHEETALDAISEIALEKRKKKMAKKQRKGKLSEKMHSISTKVNKQKETEKQKKEKKARAQVKRRVKALLGPKIEEISKKIEQSAKKGDSSYHMSALWSEDIEHLLMNEIRDWAREQGFKIETSCSSIYEPPHGSDDLPSDTRDFLIISWE